MGENIQLITGGVTHVVRSCVNVTVPTYLIPTLPTSVLQYAQVKVFRCCSSISAILSQNSLVPQSHNFHPLLG